MFREMEEQRKKRKDTDQDDGPEEEEVNLLQDSFESSKTLLCLGSHKREPREAVRITGKCKARTKERLKKEITFCKTYNKCFVRFCRRFVKSFQLDYNKRTQ